MSTKISKTIIQLQLTITIAWLLINIITAICFGDASITTLQYFYVCFMVAVLGGLTPTEKFPVRRTMWRNIVVRALYQAAILITFRFKGQAVLGISQKVGKTMIFNSFVLCQVFNWFSLREMERKKNAFKGIHRNCWFWIAVIVAVVVQMAYTEIADINSTRLNLEEWAFCFIIGAVSWVIDGVVKSILDIVLDFVHSIVLVVMVPILIK